MDTGNNDALEQNREMLQNSLRSLRGEIKNAELIDLLADMNAAGALVLRQQASTAPELLWFATGHAGFADRLFELEDDLDALLVELFMDGTIAFTVREHPESHIWWHTDARLDSGLRKPN